jgi:hypothetical protein
MHKTILVKMTMGYWNILIRNSRERNSTGLAQYVLYVYAIINVLLVKPSVKSLKRRQEVYTLFDRTHSYSENKKNEQTSFQSEQS